MRGLKGERKKGETNLYKEIILFGFLLRTYFFTITPNLPSIPIYRKQELRGGGPQH